MSGYEATIRGVCDVIDHYPHICGRPAEFRYRASGGGWMRLCEEHGTGHRKYAEAWNGEQWGAPYEPTATKRTP